MRLIMILCALFATACVSAPMQRAPLKVPGTRSGPGGVYKSSEGDSVGGFGGGLNLFPTGAVAAVIVVGGLVAGGFLLASGGSEVDAPATPDETADADDAVVVQLPGLPAPAAHGVPAHHAW